MDSRSLSPLLQRPTLRQLEYAVAVADHLHFGRAAEACHVSQPALSAQLLQLEEQLGVDLFERSRRGVLMTPEGERLIPLARAALRAADEVLDAAQAAKDPFAGVMRLGVIPTVSPYLLPYALPPLREKFPQLKLLLVEEMTHLLLERLRSGRLDVAVLALPTPGDDLTSRPLYEEHFTLALRKDHPMAKQKQVALEDLSRVEVLLLEDGHCLREQALEVCNQGRGKEVENLRATSLPTLVQMVANGIGVTLLPELASEQLIQGPELTSRPFKRPEPGRSIGLVWRRGSPRSAAFQTIGEVIAKEARSRLGRT
jgi:LysR family hydrogen peroxide-inducible transcriptional activator